MNHEKQVGTDPTQMHKFDPKSIEIIFSYLRERLSLKETPLDFPGDKEVLAKVISGLINPDGNSVEKVMEIYDQVISRSVISGDSPRFLAFIPVAPTKAIFCPELANRFML